MLPSLRFDCSGETAAQVATQALARQGWRVVRSFDLQAALDGHGLGAAEFIVLLVYGAPAAGAGRAPVVVATRGRDGQAEAQIVHDPNHSPDEDLAAGVWGILQAAALSVSQLPGANL